MKIKAIKLVDSGFKGMEVVYLKNELKDGRTVINEIKEKRRHPIHFGLEVPFKDLRFHLLRICDVLNDRMGKEEIDSAIYNCEVLAIEFSDDYFVIKGKKEVFLGKSISLKSPKVEDGDCYEYFGAVNGIIEKIVEETQLYMSGIVKVDNTEVVLRYIGAGKEKGFDMDSFNALSDEEQKEFTVNLIQNKFGGIVLMGDDVEIAESADVNDDDKNGNDIIIDASPIPFPLISYADEKENTHIVIDPDNDKEEIILNA